MTINGMLGSSGAANVVKTGSGTLIVNSSGGGLADNSTWTVQGGSYNGTTGLYNSVLGIAAGNVLGNSTGSVLNLSAGTLQFTANGGNGYLSARTINVAASGGAISDGGFAPGDATSGGSQIGPAISIASGSGLKLVSSNKLQLYGVISGNGTLTKFGSGTVILAGANTYTGVTTISGGTLQIGNGGTTGSLSASGSIINNGTLVFNRSNTVTAGTDFSGSAISGSGSIVQSGSGKLLLWSGNTFTGGVVINSGTLGIWEGSGLGAVPGSPATQLTFAGNSTLQFQQTPTALPLNANRQFVINSGVTATIDTQGFAPSIAGTISGATGALAKSGSGTLTLNGTNTYGGGTTVNAGTLQLGSATALGASTGALAVNTGAKLNMNTYSATVGALTSSNGTITGFNVGAGSNTLAASSASISGTNYLGINPSSVTATGTSNLLTSSGGGLTGTFKFAGSQNLSVPVNSLIVKNGSGGFYQVTLNNTATTEQITVTAAPSKVLSIMPLGASIMAGSSAQTPYDGGGFHTEMYQNLVNDGRFTPNFVGSSTDLQANNPTSPNLLTSAGQTNHEGHPGYTTSQVLNNLNANDSSSGNNGGSWLAPGNGVNPDYIPLNAGGNDFVANPTDTQAINRYDAIVSQVNTLRPGVATLATNLMYRTDVGTPINTYFNPYVQGVVYNHVLAGQDVRFVDLYTLMTPGNSTYPSNPYISSDGIHPTQAGYNLMGDIMYHSTVYGAAYWTGSQNGNWSTLNGSSTNWAMDSARTTNRGRLLTDSTANTYSYADVYFNNNATPLATTLGADTTVRSLNFAAGAAGAVSIGGANTLSIGSGGITVQQGTGAHTVSANIALTADQTWGNVSSHDLTVSGIVSGSNSITIVGSYTVHAGASSAAITTQSVSGTGAIVLTGSNTYTGNTTVSSGTLVVNNTGGSGTGSGSVEVLSGARLGGTGTITGGTTIRASGTLAPTAQASNGKLTLGATTFTGGSIFEWDMSPANPADDPATHSNQGTYGQVAAGATTGTSIFTIVLGSGSYADAFWNTDKTWSNIYTSSGLTDLTSLFTTLAGSFLTYDSGTRRATATGQGYFTFNGSSTLSWTAVPEPTTALVGLLLGAGLLRRRR